MELTEVLPVPLEFADNGDGTVPYKKPSLYLQPTLNVLRKIHKYSAYSFLTFVGIHTVSVVVVPLIPVLAETKQEVFEMARAVYHLIPYFEAAVVVASSAIHVLCGVAIRAVRSRINKYKYQFDIPHRKRHDSTLIKDDTRDDIGLGGITGLLGLGYKKSWISRRFPLVSPLAFSGYLLVPFLVFHFVKFRYLPWSIDGDSLLINLEYISYYLNFSALHGAGNVLNLVSLMALVILTAYHSVSGVLKWNRKFSLNWKKTGYAIIASFTLMGYFSVLGFKRNWTSIDTSGFVGKSFRKYLSAFWF